MLKFKSHFLSVNRISVFRQLSSIEMLKNKKKHTVYKEKEVISEFIKQRGERLFDDQSVAKPTLEQYRQLINDQDDEWNVNNILKQYQQMRSFSKAHWNQLTGDRQASKHMLKKHSWPSKIDVDHMEKLMQLERPGEVEGYFIKLFNDELYQWVMKLVKENLKNENHEKKKNRIEMFKEWGCESGDFLFTKNGSLIYGLYHNCLFTRIHRKHLHKYCWHRLKNATMFSPSVVFDLSYDQLMPETEQRSVGRQMWRVFCFNRQSFDPFDLHFCNCNMESGSMIHFMKLSSGSIDKRRMLINVHRESYLDLFPRDRLVYLSPDGESVLDRYDPSLVYIVGGVVGKKDNQPVSLRKARREGIRSARLPLDEYADWKSGSKCLSQTNVLYILSHLKELGDWNEALKRGIYEYKLKNHEDLAQIYANRLVNCVDRLGMF